MSRQQQQDASHNIPATRGETVTTLCYTVKSLLEDTRDPEAGFDYRVAHGLLMENALVWQENLFPSDNYRRCPSLLHKAVAHRNPKLVRLLAGKFPDLLRCKNEENGATPFQLACYLYVDKDDIILDLACIRHDSHFLTFSPIDATTVLGDASRGVSAALELLLNRHFSVFLRVLEESPQIFPSEDLAVCLSDPRCPLLAGEKAELRTIVHDTLMKSKVPERIYYAAVFGTPGLFDEYVLRFSGEPAYWNWRNTAHAGMNVLEHACSFPGTTVNIRKLVEVCRVLPTKRCFDLTLRNNLEALAYLLTFDDIREVIETDKTKEGFAFSKSALAHIFPARAVSDGQKRLLKDLVRKSGFGDLDTLSENLGAMNLTLAEAGLA